MKHAEKPTYCPLCGRELDTVECVEFGEVEEYPDQDVLQMMDESNEEWVEGWKRAVEGMKVAKKC